jgi:hypothetical protein
LLKPARELDVHLRIQLPMLISQSHQDSNRSNRNRPNACRSCYVVSEHVHHYLESNPALPDKNRPIRIEHLTYPAV